MSGRQTINTNIRLNLANEDDSRACRSILINFDAYVDNGNEIKHELVAHLYRSIMRDLTGRDGENGMYPLGGRIAATAQMFCEVFNSHENKRIIEEKYDSWNDYVYFFDKLEYTKLLYTSTAEQMHLSWEDYEIRKDTYPITDLKDHIAKLDINQLMVAIVLWDIAYTLAFGKQDQCCIVFESLDTIFNAAALPDFTKQIIYFRNNIDSILSDLNYNGASLATMDRLYTLIFVMRETTKCEFVDHFVDSVEMYIPQKSIHDLESIHRQCKYGIQKDCSVENQERAERLKIDIELKMQTIKDAIRTRLDQLRTVTTVL